MAAPVVPVLSRASDTLTIRSWPDPVIDSLGHDPRSHYVETYWLGILGPSTTWLLRRLVFDLEASPDGFELSLTDTARCLGLGDKGGRNSPFMRALTRLVQFDMAQPHGPLVLAVRGKVPPLTRRQVMRLPSSLQSQHLAMQETDLQTPVVEGLRRRGRQLALSLLELGEDMEAAERQLLRWRYHPTLAHECADWAWERYCRALRAADSAEPDDVPGGAFRALVGIPDELSTPGS